MATPTPFALAHRLSNTHLIPYPPDTALYPPPSYSHTTDFLILLCALLYTQCYAFYAIAVIRDRFLPGPVEYLAATMAYELYYGFAMPTRSWETAGFLTWFAMDAAFAATAIRFAYPPAQRRNTALRTVALLLTGLACFHALATAYPDPSHQLTAYWTGWLLETPIGWGELYYLLTRDDTRGQSLEIWLCRFLGCLAANAVFMWRYYNVPQNWAYVASWPSLLLVALTILPELVYPFVYVRVHLRMKERESRALRASKAR